MPHNRCPGDPPKLEKCRFPEIGFYLFYLVLEGIVKLGEAQVTIRLALLKDEVGWGVRVCGIEAEHS